jgi:hypothetical protein
MSHASAHHVTRLHSVRQLEQMLQLSSRTCAYDTIYEVALNGLTRLWELNFFFDPIHFSKYD